MERLLLEMRCIIWIRKKTQFTNNWPLKNARFWRPTRTFMLRSSISLVLRTFDELSKDPHSSLIACCLTRSWNRFSFLIISIQLQLLNMFFRSVQFDSYWWRWQPPVHCMFLKILNFHEMKKKSRKSTLLFIIFMNISRFWTPKSLEGVQLKGTQPRNW